MSFTDAGFMTHPLGRLASTCKEAIQDRSDRAGLGRRIERLIDLAEDLRFTENQAVEARCHAEEMLDRRRRFEAVEVWIDQFAGPAGQESRKGPTAVGAPGGRRHGNQLGPVAGRYDHPLEPPLLVQYLLHQGSGLGTRNRQALAQAKRGRVMRQAKNLDAAGSAHSGCLPEAPPRTVTRAAANPMIESSAGQRPCQPALHRRITCPR